MDIDQIIGDAFIYAQKQYEHHREIQRTCIIEKLKQNAYTKHNGKTLDYSGGRGKSKYTSGGNNKAYDLTNWKWIEAKKNNIEYMISLQSFDRDPNSSTPHILFDRISIGVILDKEIVDVKVTDIDLPMNEEKYNMLLEQLELREKNN